MSAECDFLSVMQNPKERVDREEFNLSEDLAQVKVTIVKLQATVNKLKEQHFELQFTSSQEIMKINKEVSDLKKLQPEVADLERKEEAVEERVEATQIQLDLDHQMGVSKEFTMEDLLKTSPGYCIQESMWDACAFIGFECVGWASSLLIVFVALSTIVLEVLFAIVVYVNYKQHSYTDDNLDGLLHWRTVEAQSVQNMDPTTLVSLASAVCSKAVSVGIAGSQARIYSDLKSFRGHDVGDDPMIFNGHFLCNLALLLWIVSILRDLWQNWCLMGAVARHKGGAASIQEAGDELRIVSFSFKQTLLVAFLVFIPRTVIDLMLGYAGVWFLCYTSNIGDLILNSVALVFVLDIDEMLHQALLSEKVKDLMSLVQPLPHRRNLETSCSRCSAKGYHIFWFRILTTGIALVMCDWLVIDPFNERLDMALAYLCAGNKEFVYSQGGMTGMVSIAKTQPYTSKAMYKMTYPKASVLQLLDLPKKYADRFKILSEGPQAAIERPPDVLIALATTSLNEESSTLFCLDHSDMKVVRDTYRQPKMSNGYWLSTQALFHSYGLRESPKDSREPFSCSDLDFEQYCLSPTASIFRAICAKSCACDTPWQGQFFATGLSGCPPSCSAEWEVSAQYLVPATIAQYTDECKDVPKEVLFTEQSWQNYVKGLSYFMGVFSTKNSVARASSLLLEFGCEGLLVAVKYLDVCNPVGKFRSARSWCPRTCLCSSSNMKECPNSCSYKLRYHQMPAGHACTPMTEVESAAECKKAHYSLKEENRNITAWNNAFAPPSGCFLSSAGLMFSDTGGGTLDSGSIAICRAHPLLFDTLSQGSFETGQDIAVKWMFSSSDELIEEGIIR